MSIDSVLNKLFGKQEEKINSKTPTTTIGFIGLTGSGKSTLINTLLGEQLAPVSYCSTTQQTTSFLYQSKIALYDTKGLEDGTEYLNNEKLIWLQSLNERILVINYSLREVISMVNLLNTLSLTFCVIVNKCDRLPIVNLPKFRDGIESEIKELTKKSVPLFFLSKYEMLDHFKDDWIQFKTFLNARRNA